MYINFQLLLSNSPSIFSASSEKAYLVCSKVPEKADDWQRVRDQTQASVAEPADVPVSQAVEILLLLLVMVPVPILAMVHRDFMPGVPNFLCQLNRVYNFMSRRTLISSRWTRRNCQCSRRMTENSSFDSTG